MCLTRALSKPSTFLWSLLSKDLKISTEPSKSHWWLVFYCNYQNKQHTTMSYLWVSMAFIVQYLQHDSLHFSNQNFPLTYIIQWHYWILWCTKQLVFTTDKWNLHVHEPQATGRYVQPWCYICDCILENLATFWHIGQSDVIIHIS